MSVDPDEYILAIDVETTGQGLKTNFMTCIGAALIKCGSCTVVDTFESYLKQPDGTCWEQRCVDEFWSKFPDLFEKTKIEISNALPADIVMKKFLDWVLKVTKDRKCVIVFDTAGFDQSWVDYNIGHTSCSYIMGYYKPTRDISSYMLGLAKLGVHGYGAKASVVKIAKEDFPVWNVNHDHNPSNDAAVTGLNASWVSKIIS